MNAEVKAKWIEALRSGRYKQVRDVLHNDDGYCCLGVLCRITGRRFKKEGEAYLVYDKLYGDWRESMPPKGLLETIDLSVPKAEKLAGMNDKGKTFAQIAAWIEKNL